MTQAAATPWTSRRTDETRQVEQVLRDAGFEQVDAYRYNAASIRLRVVDSRFEGRPPEERDAFVEPELERLPERTQADIVSLFTFAPSELRPTNTASRQRLLNAEFEDPSPSRL